MKQYEMKSELARHAINSMARSDKKNPHSTMGGTPPVGFVPPRINSHLSQSQRALHDMLPLVHCAEGRRRLQAPLQGLQLKSESDEPEYYTRKEERRPWGVPREPIRRYQEDSDGLRTRFGIMPLRGAQRRETQRQNRSQILNDLRTRRVFKEERLGTRPYNQVFQTKPPTHPLITRGQSSNKKLDFSWRGNPHKQNSRTSESGFRQPKELFTSLMKDQAPIKKNPDLDCLFKRTRTQVRRYPEEFMSQKDWKNKHQQNIYGSGKVIKNSPTEPPMIRSFVKLGLERDVSLNKQNGGNIYWDQAKTQKRLDIFKDKIGAGKELYSNGRQMVLNKIERNVKVISRNSEISKPNEILSFGRATNQQNNLEKTFSIVSDIRYRNLNNLLPLQTARTIPNQTPLEKKREVQNITLAVGPPEKPNDMKNAIEIFGGTQRKTLNIIPQSKGQLLEVTERKDLLIRCSGCKCVNARIETHQDKFLIRTPRSQDLYANFPLHNANALRSKGDAYPLGNLKQLLLKMLLREQVGAGLRDFNIFELKLLHAVLMKRFKGLYSGNGNKLRALYAKKALAIPDNQIDIILSSLKDRYQTTSNQEFKDKIMSQEISFKAEDLKAIRGQFLHPNYLNLMVENEPVKRLEEQLKFVLSRAEHSLIIEFLEKTQGLTKEQIDRKLKTERFKVEVAFYQEYFGELAEEHAIPIQKFYFPRNKNKLVCNSHKTINRTYIHNVSLNREYVTKVRAFISGPLLTAEKLIIRNKVSNKIDKWNTFLHKQLSFGQGDKGLGFFDQFVEKNILKNDKFKLPWSVRQIEAAVGTVLKHLT